MNATEIRLGNWVQDWAGSVFKQVCSLDDDLIECDWNNGGFYVEPHPIPLTPEILTKCGFEQDLHPPAPVYTLNDVTIFYKMNECDDFYFPFGRAHAITFKYLHQLQNLFFALTNQELSISL